MRRLYSLLLIISMLLAGTPELAGDWTARAVAGTLNQSATAGDPVVPNYPALPASDGSAGAEAEVTAQATPSYSGNSGMNPYTSLYQGRERDEVFIADTDNELDQYLFVNSSPLTFRLPITRHYGEVDGSGYLKNASTMISKGIISDKALLFIRVFDVDNDYQGGEAAPERDILKINGRVLYPALTSGNNTWSTLTYRVPVTYLKFPAPGALGQAPTPAQNDIAIDIDTSNGGRTVWAIEVDWAGLVLPGVRPAALVNGFLGNAGTWDNFSQLLANDGLVSEPVEVDAYSGIGTNAGILLRELPRVKQKYGVERLNIIAHSKGGLDSRAYLRQRRDIDTLVQLGTPNRGSDCANVLAGYLSAATRNLRPDWMARNFNNRTPEQGAAPLYTLIGTAYSNRFCGYFIGRVNVRLDPPHDGFVSADRATLPWRWSGVDNDGLDQGNVDGYIPVDHETLHERQSVADLAVKWLRANTGMSSMAMSAATGATSTAAMTADSSANSSTQAEPTPDPAPTFIDAIVGKLA
ncbi:MAG TPA: hypothetical protein VGD58_26995, partial [Herpetosiphonaceae bacterium]